MSEIRVELEVENKKMKSKNRHKVDMSIDNATNWSLESSMNNKLVFDDRCQESIFVQVPVLLFFLYLNYERSLKVPFFDQVCRLFRLLSHVNKESIKIVIRGHHDYLECVVDTTICYRLLH